MTVFDCKYVPGIGLNPGQDLQVLLRKLRSRTFKRGENDVGGRFKVLQLLPKKVSYFRIYSPTLTCVSPVSRMIRQIGTVKRIHTHTQTSLLD